MHELWPSNYKPIEYQFCTADHAISWAALSGHTAHESSNSYTLEQSMDHSYLPEHSIGQRSLLISQLVKVLH